MRTLCHNTNYKTRCHAPVKDLYYIKTIKLLRLTKLIHSFDQFNRILSSSNRRGLRLDGKTVRCSTLLPTRPHPRIGSLEVVAKPLRIEQRSACFRLQALPKAPQQPGIATQTQRLRLVVRE